MNRKSISKDEDDKTKCQEVLLWKEVPRIQRTNILTCPGYFRWRKHLWDRVNDHLVKLDLVGLKEYYKNEYEIWLFKNKPDMAIVTLCRQAITLSFNGGIPEALKLMKLAWTKLHQLPNFANRLFMEAGVSIIFGLLYISKQKFGTASSWLNKAKMALDQTESCEFTAECNYVFAKYYLCMYGIMKKESLQIDATQFAKRSRDVCMDLWDKGEWYALHAVESLFLLVRVNLNADNFPDVKRVEELCLSEPWTKEKIRENEYLVNKVTFECEKLKYNYIYVELGLAKCRCILEIKWMQLYRSNALFALAMDKCKSARLIAENCLRKCEAVLKKEGFIMSKFVHRTNGQFHMILQILNECHERLTLLQQPERPLAEAMSDSPISSNASSAESDIL